VNRKQSDEPEANCPFQGQIEPQSLRSGRLLEHQPARHSLSREKEISLNANGLSTETDCRLTQKDYLT